MRGCAVGLCSSPEFVYRSTQLNRLPQPKFIQRQHCASMMAVELIHTNCYGATFTLHHMIAQVSHYRVDAVLLQPLTQNRSIGPRLCHSLSFI